MLTPKAGSEILAIAAYLPQHRTKLESQTYQNTLHWLHTALTIDHPNTPALLGGDLHANPSPHPASFRRSLADLLADTLLTHVGDPLTPTYTPTNSPLDHWLMRIPKDTTQPQTTTAILYAEYIGHNALLAGIPQIGDPNFHLPSVDPYPTTRDHPPSILPIPKSLIYLYKFGNDNTRTSQQENLLSAQQLLDSDQVTTDQIDKAAKLVVKAIDEYHLLAQTI
jgi:hypothetical protein